MFPCVAIDADRIKIAAELSERYRISYRDSAIAAAAETLNTRMLYTEELDDGQIFGKVGAVNPFTELRHPNPPRRHPGNSAGATCFLR